ncbi:tail fiber domain-containing protein [bacterium]|nr:tail fiber domain-containing protein [bacterium]
MKKLICLIFVGLFTFLHAQGITNTLGGNTSNDKFIIKNISGTDIFTIIGWGYVGIGINNPQAKLHVISSSNTGVDNTAKFESTTLGINASHIHYGTKGDWYIRSAASDGKVVIQDSGGNVGIGTKNPLAKLSVGGDGHANATIYGEATGDWGRGVYGEATGSEGLGVYGAPTGSYGRGVSGYVSGDLSLGVYGYATGISGTGVYGCASGSSGRGITGSGGEYDFYADNTSSIDYGSRSSVRWKTNIVEIDKPLEKLSGLRGVYFNWDEEHGGQHDVGCIAEEVGKVLPEIVVYEENGIDADGMDYSKLTPLLIEAIKALQKRVEELERR